jgi:hypothetical protein
MNGDTASMARKRPPELALLEGNATTSGLTALPSGSRLRTTVSPLDTKPEAKRNVSTRKHKRKAETLPFLTQAQIRLEASAQQANLALEKQLRRHGRYISRHPVRTLLLACLIITSLFYPAAGIYLWASKGGPGVTRGDARSVWRSLSTPLLDSFASSGRKHHNSLRDLRMIWDDAPDLNAVDARDADYHLSSITPFNLLPNSWPTEATKVEEDKCQAVRVEHVFVTTDDIMRGTGSRHGALDTPILQSVLSLQSAVEDRLTSDQGGLKCVQAADSTGCLTLSPLSYWQHQTDLVAQDSSPTSTLLNSKLNLTGQGIPLSLTTTLAGRGHLFTHLPRADHLVLTFFLQDGEEDCHQKTYDKKDESHSKSHEAWLSILRDITGGQVGILNSEITATKEVVLQFVPKESSNKFLTQRFLLASAYVAVFVWLCRGLIKIQNVHSRFGLAFTALLELVISMTLAISICALCGVRLTLVPWEVLPFVVVVIGSESMFVLTNAIISTPISLSVTTRVATGLAKVGVAIAVTVMSDVILMSAIMMLVDVRAVREFCIFAIFALFVDFFMQMTFFATVLSIDLQRLELADLLSQGGSKEGNGMPLNNIPDNESVASDLSANGDANDDTSRRKPAQKSTAAVGGSLIKLSCRAVWRARTARTASLSLLLAFMFGIYLYHGSGYTSQHSYPMRIDNSTIQQSAQVPPTSTFNTYETARFNPFSHLSRNDDTPAILPLPWWHRSPSASFWHALNPQDAPSVRVKVEPWTVLSLRSTKIFEGQPNRSVAHFASWAIFRPRVRAFIWFFKLVILPISGTTGLLYILLLYLLKDTELLDAQLNKSDGAEMSDEDEEVEKPTEDDNKNDMEINLRTSSTSHTSDVVIVRQSGGYIASLASDSSLSIWKPSKRAQKSKTIVLSAVMTDYSRITALEIDIDMDLIALGHVSGSVSFWTLSSLQLIEAIKTMKKSQNEADVEASKPVIQVQSLFILPSLQDRYAVLSAHRDGSIWKWTKEGQVCMLAPQTEALWVAYSPTSSEGDCRNIIALSSSDHRFQLYRISVDLETLTSLLTSQPGTSVVRCATLSTLMLGEDECSRAATWATAVVGTSRGSIVVYDMGSGSVSGQYDILDGPITSIRAVECASACPNLSHTVCRDVLLANSSMQATILALTGSTDGSPSAPTFKRSPTSASQRRRNGNSTSSPTGSTSAREKLTAEGLSPRQPSFSHGNGTSNGFKEEEPIPFSLGVPTNGIKIRRSSMQRANHDNLSPPLLSASHDTSHQVNSSIGSAHSSVLGHFDADPFDNNGTNFLHWARLASIECIRGGSDLVMGSDGAKVIGVRRRMKQSNVFALDSRWEAFQIDVSTLFSDQLSKFSLETSFVKRCRLDVEDSVFLDQTSDAAVADFPLQRSVHFASPSRITAPLLSFTRLNHVEAFYKERGTKKKKRTIIFTFANCVGAILFYPPSQSSVSSI